MRDLLARIIPLPWLVWFHGGLKPYVWNLLVSLDQLANVLFSPLLNRMLTGDRVARFGNPDETISSVFGKNIKLGTCKLCVPICKVLSVLDRKNERHCIASIEYDEGEVLIDVQADDKR